MNLKHISSCEIVNKRNEIRKKFVEESPNVKGGVISKLGFQDLNLLFQLYDEAFFCGFFKQQFRGKLKLSLSGRMTSNAGKTIYPRNLGKMNIDDATFEIRIGTSFFFNYYEVEGPKKVNGIESRDALEALQLVFEHELCHLLELVECKESSCKGDRFKHLAKDLFGHQDVYHALPSSRQIAEMQHGVRVGNKVSFFYKDREMTGVINNISKRATVMVKDDRGNYVDKRGNRYAKYYVPLENLRV